MFRGGARTVLDSVFYIILLHSCSAEDFWIPLQLFMIFSLLNLSGTVHCVFNLLIFNSDPQFSFRANDPQCPSLKDDAGVG